MTDAQKAQATEALNVFWTETFGFTCEVNYSACEAVPFYYTQTLDGEANIQFYANFENPSIYFEVNEERIWEEPFESFDALCEHIKDCMTEAGLLGEADELCFERGLCEYR